MGIAKQQNIRNFCIIAHVDHGKSTLADRILEITNTVDKRLFHEQFLDTLELEQERGITIKLQTARMLYQIENEVFILNLIDTPGHVDFSFEVSRSILACEGAILLVDASQGVEAQTISNALKAIDNNLVIIPVINKIDLPNANPESCVQEMIDIFGFNKDDFIFVSAKTGQGINDLMKAIIKKIPSPTGGSNSKLQCLIFDSFYDEYKGVIALVKLVNGTIQKSDILNKKKIYFLGSNVENIPLEIGYMRPFLSECDAINVGEVGYIATGIKDIKMVRVGDTITFFNDPAEPVIAFKKAKPMVFASLYPVESDKYDDFRIAFEKLSLNDAALEYFPEVSPVLGSGFRCGFLGMLHMEIIQDRLEKEYGINTIITAPSVEYKIQINAPKIDYFGKKNIPIFNEDGKFFIKINSASQIPEQSYIVNISEPWVNVDLLTPVEFIGDIMQLCQNKRGVYLNTYYLNSNTSNHFLNRAILKYEMPLIEVISDFFDKVKSLTHGFGSINYEFKEYRISDIVKISILINGKDIDALSFFAPMSSAFLQSKNIISKLKTVIPRHQFRITLQAAIGSKIIVRDDILPYRKDVTKGLSGGDHRRKLKHLERQKEGKKRLKQFGSVQIPQEAFWIVFKKD